MPRSPRSPRFPRVRRLAPAAFAIVALLAAAVPAVAQPAPPIAAEGAIAAPRLLVQGITADADGVVFASGGRLWRAPFAGGTAAALTPASTDEDAYPAVSPDGLWIAFSRFRGGNLDVWALPAAGGEALRLTYHPKDDRVRGWTPDGAAILLSSGRAGDGTPRLYTVPAPESTPGLGAPPFPTPLPLPWGEAGAFSPDGERLAYTPVSMRSNLSFHDRYRYYRGGLTSPLWIADLATSRVEVVGEPAFNHHDPMWIGDRVYTICDETGIFDLCVHDPASGERRRLTSFQGFGVRAVGRSAAGERIVFVRGGRIHSYELASGAVREIPVALDRGPGELAPRTAAAADYLTQVVPLAGGDRFVAGARGEVLILAPGAAAGVPDSAESDAPPALPLAGQNLTRTPGAAEREPVPSPDGSRVAYFSDAGGEYALHVAPIPDGTAGPAAGASAGLVLPVEERPSFYRQPVWSPEGRRIAFTGKRLGLWLADLETERVERIERSEFLAQELYHPSWSPDGRYLAYAKGFPDHFRRVFVYDTANGERHRVSGPEHAEQPVFDRNGKYLHYLASNDTPFFGGRDIWGVQSADSNEPLVVKTVFTVLLHPGEPFPLLPFGGGAHPAARPGESAPAAPIDFAGIGSRIATLPVPERDYLQLAAGPPGVLLLRWRSWPEAPADSRASVATPLARYRIGADRAPVELAADPDDVWVAADGDTVVWEGRDGLARLSGLAADELAAPTALDLSGIEIAVDPAAEHRQIFHEAWRLMRDYFYDPGHHGQDLAALEAHYAEYLPGITRREELNDLLREMLGHVSVSHLGVAGGDAPGGGDRDRTGTLGAEFTVDRGRYRIAEVFGASPSSTHALVRFSPLDQAGMEVAPGEYLLAVEGRELDASENLYAALAGTAYEPTRITIGPHPDDAGRPGVRAARELVVVPVGGDNTIQRQHWFEENRRRVEKLSGGRLGYVPARDYSEGTFREIFRDLAAAAGKEGLILDERFGLGGTTADTLVELLAAAPLHRYAFPYGEDLRVPTTQPPPVQVVLINEFNVSASETFPLMYGIAGRGTMVGKRTAGAGVGPAMDYPRFVDGGRIRIPNRAGYDPTTGRWLENEGVAPDVEVEWWPEDWRAGRDPQLEAAVAIALERIVARRDLLEGEDGAERPAYPIHP